jgi:hypothetical protein
LQQPGWLLGPAIQLAADQQHAQMSTASPPSPPTFAQMVRVRVLWAAWLLMIVIAAFGVSMTAVAAAHRAGEVWPAVAVHAVVLALLLILLLVLWLCRRAAAASPSRS